MTNLQYAYIILANAFMWLSGFIFGFKRGRIYMHKAVMKIIDDALDKAPGAVYVKLMGLNRAKRAQNKNNEK